MKTIRQSNAISHQTRWLILLLAIVYLWPAKADDTKVADATPEYRKIAAIRIVDQHGRQAVSGKREAGNQIFDVTVGPIGNEFTFDPDTATIRVGDTVRWTWASDFHMLLVAPLAQPMGNFVHQLT